MEFSERIAIQIIYIYIMSLNYAEKKLFSFKEFGRTAGAVFQCLCILKHEKALALYCS